jgi:GT2 family glycosyltransferase
VHDGWLDPLVDALAAQHSVGAAQSLIVDSDATVGNAGLILAAPDFLPIARTDHGSGSADIDAFSGIAVMFRAQDFAEFHGFDVLFSNGLEDVDLALRMKEKTGVSFTVCTESVVTHLGIFSPGRFNAMGTNERIFATRWHDKLANATRPDQPPISLGQN